MHASYLAGLSLALLPPIHPRCLKIESRLWSQAADRQKACMCACMVHDACRCLHVALHVAYVCLHAALHVALLTAENCGMSSAIFSHVPMGRLPPGLTGNLRRCLCSSFSSAGVHAFLAGLNSGSSRPISIDLSLTPFCDRARHRCPRLITGVCYQGAPACSSANALDVVDAATACAGSTV